MSWISLNNYVDMWEQPVLGSIDQKDGKRFMALCVDPSSKNPYRGIARQVTERIGNQDVPGYVDKSKLVLVKSNDLLNWEVDGDLNIEGINDLVNKMDRDELEFIGLEDPDILVDDRGIKHIYFTIPLKYKNKDWYDVYVGHAFGKDLTNLSTQSHVLEKVDNEIVGFKEICPLSFNKKGKDFILAETFVDRGGERKFSATSLIQAKDHYNKWKFIKLLHDPEIENREWCSGHSSPCRIFKKSFLSYKGYYVGILNGREKTKIINGNKLYGKFRPGLFLFDDKKQRIVWLSDEPLFEDPLATTITFSSELIYLNKKEAIIYAHPNDSFIRAYRLNSDKLKKLLQKNVNLT